MGALPKKKVTRARQGKRASHFYINPKNLSLCPECNSPKLPHRACLNCGSYKGRAAIRVQSHSDG